MQVLCIVTVKVGGRCTATHMVKIAVHLAKGCGNTQKACPKLRWVCHAFVDFTCGSYFAINFRLIHRKMPLYMFPLVQPPNSNFSSLLDGLGTRVQISVNISPK